VNRDWRSLSRFIVKKWNLISTATGDALLSRNFSETSFVGMIFAQLFLLQDATRKMGLSMIKPIDYCLTYTGVPANKTDAESTRLCGCAPYLIFTKGTSNECT